MAWVGLPVRDAAGERVGTCTAVYADDATGLPEWALVQGGSDSQLHFLPLVDARVEGDSLRVGFSAEQVDTAPRLGNQGHLTEAEETELYQHYGVPYSAEPSDTVLPAAVGDTAEASPEDTTASATLTAAEEPDMPADTMPPMEPMPEPVVPEPSPEPLQPEPAPAPPEPAPAPEPLRPESPQPAPAPEPPQMKSAPEPTPPSSGATAPTPPARPPSSSASSTPERPTVDAAPGRNGPSVERLVSAAAGVTTAVVLLLRERRRTGQKPGQAGVGKAGAALGTAADVIAGAAETLGSQFGRATGSLGDAASDVAKSGSRAVGDVAKSGSRAVGDAADSARDAAVSTRRQVRRSWRRTTTRGVALMGAATGYLLGARAGQRRYQQIRDAASGLRERLGGGS